MLFVYTQYLYCTSLSLLLPSCYYYYNIYSSNYECGGSTRNRSTNGTKVGMGCARSNDSKSSLYVRIYYDLLMMIIWKKYIRVRCSSSYQIKIVRYDILCATLDQNIAVTSNQIISVKKIGLLEHRIETYYSWYSICNYQHAISTSKQQSVLSDHKIGYTETASSGQCA